MTEILSGIGDDENVGLISTSRFSFTKKVKETTEAMKKLLQSSKFDIIAHPPPPEALVPSPQESTFDFESRKNIEERIMTSLMDNEVYKVGICGMGGVGKTTLAKRIRHRVSENRLFEEIVMVVVSQNADMVRIQEDISRSLGLKLEEGSLSSKAHLLRTRLSDSAKRSLIIVDDVWEYLNLVDLGIPCSSRCKVLLTSRDTGVFKKMNVEKVHGVNLLTEAEAWDFFQLNAGSCVGHPNVVSVAQQVVEECKGLPIALKTVGTALKDTENASIWGDSLQQLRSSNPSDMPDVLNDVYKPLRLSYDSLHNEQVQSLFLMCCLYPEDYQIPIEELAIYVIGLGLFEEIKRLEHIRNRVYSLVKNLNSRFLLVEGRSKNHVMMHDVVRDVAVFIASGKKWITTHSQSNDCTWISPYIRETIGLHGGSAIYPNLHLLWIDCDSRYEELGINNHIFEGMKELHVLSIKSSPARRLPETTFLLKNLRTLVLQQCQSLESISAVGELVNLKILVCRRCDSMESLPMEIGRLSGLKLLQLSVCKKLKTIAPGIISRLTELEELIVWKCFDGWEAKNMGKESKNALLSELEQLSSLSSLVIEIKDSRLFAEQIRLSPKLIGYHIKIGNMPEVFDDLIWSQKRMPYERIMWLQLPENVSLGDWIHELVRSVEYMIIEGDGSRFLDFGLAQNMRVLIFQNCSTVKTLVSTKTTATVFPHLQALHLENLVELKEICDIGGPMSSNAFNNLRQLTLENLPRLERLNIGFPVLEKMEVIDCERLKSFVCTTSPDDDDDIHIFCKPHKFEFGSLKQLAVGGYFGSLCRNWCPMMIGIFTRLSTLYVSQINGMKSLFPYSVAQNLHNLRRLTIKSCDDMVGVIEHDACGGENPANRLLPNLSVLSLLHLEKLKSFCQCKYALEFPSLTSLVIKGCDSMEEFTSGHVSTPILQYIKIEGENLSSNDVNASLKQHWLKRQERCCSNKAGIDMLLEQHERNIMTAVRKFRSKRILFEL